VNSINYIDNYTYLYTEIYLMLVKPCHVLNVFSNTWGLLKQWLWRDWWLTKYLSLVKAEWWRRVTNLVLQHVVLMCVLLFVLLCSQQDIIMHIFHLWWII